MPPPPPIDAEACIIEAMGESAIQQIYAGNRSPTTEELEAFVRCYGGRSDGALIAEMAFPDFETLPEISAPMEIGTVVWPSSVQNALALLERLPYEIFGHRLTERQGGLGNFQSDVYFGEDPETQEPVLVAGILDVNLGFDFPSNTTGGEFVAYSAQRLSWRVLAAGREGILGWVQIESNDTSGGVTQDVYSMYWGSASGSAVFYAQANGPADLAAVVQAMVAAAR